jgi:crossover junction endodeoxyribonuclease RusA
MGRVVTEPMTDTTDTTMVAFTVPGRPAPQGSKTFKGFRSGRGVMVESSREVGPWRERVALAAHNAMCGRTLLAGPITIALDFVLPRPKSAPKRSTPYATKRPDTFTTWPSAAS